MEVLKYRHMFADSSTSAAAFSAATATKSHIVTHDLLVRMHRYNQVSFGAIFAACAGRSPAPYRLIVWKGETPPPSGLFQRPTMVLYSFMFPHLEKVGEEVIALRQQARQTGQAVFFVAGGAHVSLAPQIGPELGFDLTVSGEAEQAFAEILQQWLLGSPPTGILRLPRAEIDLDQFPGFAHLTGYFPPLEISRGCRFGCSYCAVPTMYGCTLRHRSIPVITEILREMLHWKPTRKRIKFLASNAFAYGSVDGRTVNLDALRELLGTVKGFGFENIKFGAFPGEVRPDFVTPAVLRAITPFISHKTVVMGVQSGSDRMLQRMNRGHSSDQAVAAIRYLHEFGYTAHVDFIIGNPGETDQDQVDLLDFMEDMIRRYGIRVHMHTFMPLPGTAWRNERARSILPPIKERLHTLERAGHLDGWWENQIAYSRKDSKGKTIF